MPNLICSSSTRSVSPVSEKTGGSMRSLPEQCHFSRLSSQQHSEAPDNHFNNTEEMLEANQDFLGSAFASYGKDWQAFDEPKKKTNQTPAPLVVREGYRDGVGKSSSVAMWGKKRHAKHKTEGSGTSDMSPQLCSSDASTVIWAPDEWPYATLMQMENTYPSGGQSGNARRPAMEDSEVSMMAKAELECLRNERGELNHLRIANRELLVANDYLLQEHGRIVQELRCRLRLALAELDKWNLAYTSLPHRFVHSRSEGDVD
ncbi:hypothetical protein FOL47_008040 [Perkinsus chesapeaki]|uniref:Uncharacterized protein n=1 Tax=Perkinsus chesapeaki TaxID=330153 RepID=A0A7J6N2H0_PERCH|nr:hypothetical protein FOL47_008040 [Perkinsus chesapeaki]